MSKRPTLAHAQPSHFGTYAGCVDVKPKKEGLYQAKTSLLFDKIEELQIIIDKVEGVFGVVLLPKIIDGRVEEKKEGAECCSKSKIELDFNRAIEGINNLSIKLRKILERCEL